MQLQKYCSKGEVGQTSHPCTFPRAFSTEFKYNQSSDPLNTSFLFYGYPTGSLDASHDPSTGRFPNRSRSPMQYAAFDRGCQFQYHIGKRSEPRVSAPDENRQRQRKIKAGCVRDAVLRRVARESRARRTYQADSSRRNADLLRRLRDGVGGIPLPLSGRWCPLGCYPRHAQAALHSSSDDETSRLLGVSLRSHRRRGENLLRVDDDGLQRDEST